jgi:hypothetical protein
MAIRFLRRDGSGSYLVDVGRDNPLPVEVRNGYGNSVITEPSNIDILLIGDVSNVGSTARDLLGSTDSETPTITQAFMYRRFILYLYVPSAATIGVVLRGRATTTSGVPINIGWLTLFSGSVSAGAGTWHRFVLQSSDGAPLGGDQYRIEITSTGSDGSSVNQTISFSLKGER